MMAGRLSELNWPTSSSSYPASNANDGNTGTRWSASAGSTRTLTVDLGSRQDISRVVVDWYTDYASSYRIYTSNDNSNWSERARNENGDGGVDTLSFNTVEARYVRLECRSARYSYYGNYGVKEFKVYQQ